MPGSRDTTKTSSSGVDLRSDVLYGSGDHDNAALGRAFRWLDKTGIGRGSGTPIGWHQMHNCAAIDAIERDAKALGGDLAHVKVKDGVVYAGRVRLSSPRTYFDTADRAARK